MNSRQKGKRGELEWASYLRERGFDAQRGVQYSGRSGEAPDVRSKALGQFHFEVKRVEAGNPYDWLAQAIRDSGARKDGAATPLVAHRRSHKDWVIILRADDFFNLYLQKGA